MLKSFSFGLVVLGCCSLIGTIFAQDKDTYSNPDLRFEIRKPDAWRFEEQSKAPLTLFIKPPLAHDVDRLHVFAVLVVTSVPGMNSADELPPQREMIWNSVLHGTVQEGEARACYNRRRTRTKPDLHFRSRRTIHTMGGILSCQEQHVVLAAIQSSRESVRQV